MGALSLCVVSLGLVPLGPLQLRPTGTREPRLAVGIRASLPDDAGEIDWDKEAAALARVRGIPADNKFFKAIRAISPPELVQEFAQTAPRDVQIALRATVGQLMGSLPPEVAQSEVTTSGKNLGSLMFSMQMTGYMFRNAQYRKSLRDSLEGSTALLEAVKESEDLPPISGKITVQLGEGVKTEVDAAAYMSELRAEVQGLRAQLLAKGEEQESAARGGGLMAYIQALGPQDAQSLSSGVSEEVLTAMSQLVSSLLVDMNIPYDEMAVTAPAVKLRELLVTQLVAGYKLREMEARDEIKDKFWS
uniref:Uncharacterized protein n=1 Tax=Coccolithus braarudii TaxID=221442 RepID=A0A7S0LCU2_9EUKA|mmetsp:Transcript_31357/g.67425  ORF Transcript_31357/g.67425 Transcript_31357/m.67425 type:complete len:304 (+) Transcript_31357:33-944(+)